MLRLHVREGCEDALVAAFKEHRILAAAREECGLVSAQLLRPSTPGGPFVVIGQWQRAADYACWLESPVRARLADVLVPLLAAEAGSGETYSLLDAL